MVLSFTKSVCEDILYNFNDIYFVRVVWKRYVLILTFAWFREPASGEQNKKQNIPFSYGNCNDIEIIEKIPVNFR